MNDVLKPFLAFSALFCLLQAVSLKAQQRSGHIPGYPGIHVASDSAMACSRRGAQLSSQALQVRSEYLRRDSVADAEYIRQKRNEANDLFRRAAGEFRRALTYDSIYPNGWNNLGTSYYFLDTNQRLALHCFQCAIRFDPQLASAFFNAGLSYDKLGVKDSAKLMFRKCISLDSGYVQAYDQLARIWIKQNRTDSALVLLQRAVDRNPRSEAAWNNLSRLHLALRDTAAAISDMEKAAALVPENTTRLYNLSEYFRLHGDSAKQKYYLDLYEEQRKNSRQR